MKRDRGGREIDFKVLVYVTVEADRYKICRVIQQVETQEELMLYLESEQPGGRKDLGTYFL